MRRTLSILGAGGEGAQTGSKPDDTVQTDNVPSKGLCSTINANVARVGQRLIRGETLIEGWSPFVAPRESRLRTDWRTRSTLDLRE